MTLCQFQEVGLVEEGLDPSSSVIDAGFNQNSSMVKTSATWVSVQSPEGSLIVIGLKLFDPLTRSKAVIFTFSFAWVSLT